MRNIALILFVSFPLMAQSRNGDCSIGGTVVNSVTGEPVRNALVSITRMPVGDDGEIRGIPSAAPRTAMTGAGGDFQIGGLSAGEYSASLQKPGFTLPPDGFRQLGIHLTSSTASVQFKLAPLGSIEGTVLDQYGEPVRGVRILAVQARVQDGYRILNTAHSATTDDRGMYRLGELQPGKYYVKAAGRSSGTYKYIGDGAPVYVYWESFAPVYSTGGRDLSSATPLSIDAATNATVDFKLTLEPAFKIRGVLSNFPSSETVTFELRQGDDDASPSRVTLNSATGRFEVHDALPGSYVLRASQGQKLRAETPVTVTGADVEGVSLELAAAVPVKSTVHTIAAENNSAPANAAILPSGRSLSGTCQVSLHSSSGSDRAVYLQPQTADVLPGRYRVQVSCFGGYPVSVLCGNTDLLVDPTILVQPGVAPAPIEITMKMGGGTLKGKIAVNPAPANAGVLLIPESGGSGARMIPVFQMPQDAPAFQVPFLAPGDYSVYLFSNWTEVEFRDPEFLRSLTGGVRAHVGDDGEQQVTLESLVK